MEAHQILVYRDEGVDAHSFRLIVRGVREALPSYSVHGVTRQSFLSLGWEAKTAAVIFPGGRDQPYHAALKGPANQRLKNYVGQGGRYLGICAGGYYGADSIIFEEGGSLEIKEKRELGFYPGLAFGPVYGLRKFCYENLDGVRPAKIAWEGGECHVYFNGGCAFQGAPQEAQIDILATYSDLPGQPSAIVQCPYGLGKALLSGVHPEYGVYALTSAHHALEGLEMALSEDEEQRHGLWLYLLQKLLN